MTVEKWLRGHFQGFGTQIEKEVLEVAVISSLDVGFRAVSLNDDFEDFYDDKEIMKGLKYALSTLYYSMSSAITGGTRSEQRGNRQISIGGYPLTTRDREAFRNRADQIRKELGLDPEISDDQTGGLFDGASYRVVYPKRCL